MVHNVEKSVLSNRTFNLPEKRFELSSKSFLTIEKGLIKSEYIIGPKMIVQIASRLTYYEK